MSNLSNYDTVSGSTPGSRYIPFGNGQFLDNRALDLQLALRTSPFSLATMNLLAPESNFNLEFPLLTNGGNLSVNALGISLGATSVINHNNFLMGGQIAPLGGISNNRNLL